MAMRRATTGYQALSGQVVLPDGSMQFYAILAAALIIGFFLAVVVWTIWRKVRLKGEALELDSSFLDRIKQGNLLTDKELRQVRESLVRQALKKAEPAAPPATMADLQNIVTGGALLPKNAGVKVLRKPRPAGAPSVAGEQEHPDSRPSPPAASLAPGDKSPGSPDSSSPASPGVGNVENTQALGIEALLERGLISREEYEALRAHFDRNPEEDKRD